MMKPLNAQETQLFAQLLQRAQIAGTEQNPISDEQRGHVVFTFDCPITGIASSIIWVNPTEYALLDAFVPALMCEPRERGDYIHEAINWLKDWAAGRAGPVRMREEVIDLKSIH